MKFLKITAVAAFIFVNYLSFNPQNGGSILKLDGLAVMNALAECETVECWEGKTTVCADALLDQEYDVKCFFAGHNACTKDC